MKQGIAVDTLLEIDNLHTAYGASQILFGVGLSMRAGEVTTLLGRNGMGKTTTCLLYTSPSPRD